MGDERKPLEALEELRVYLGRESSIEMRNRPVQGILERTVLALEAGATPGQIKEIFRPYLPRRGRGDPTYG